MESNPDLEALRRFHGHLGPYVVIGYRMGLAARERFPDKIFAEVWSGTTRPLSCILDGIQFSSCCTLGKGNIKVMEKGEAKARFSDGTNCFEMALIGSIKNDIDRRTTRETEDRISYEMFSVPFEDIISLKERSSDRSGT